MNRKGWLSSPMSLRRSSKRFLSDDEEEITKTPNEVRPCNWQLPSLSQSSVDSISKSRNKLKLRKTPLKRSSSAKKANHSQSPQQLAQDIPNNNSHSQQPLARKDSQKYTQQQRNPSSKLSKPGRIKAAGNKRQRHKPLLTLTQMLPGSESQLDLEELQEINRVQESQEFQIYPQKTANQLHSNDASTPKGYQRPSPSTVFDLTHSEPKSNCDEHNPLNCDQQYDAGTAHNSVNGIATTTERNTEPSSDTEHVHYEQDISGSDGRSNEEVSARNTCGITTNVVCQYITASKGDDGWSSDKQHQQNSNLQADMEYCRSEETLNSPQKLCQDNGTMLNSTAVGNPVVNQEKPTSQGSATNNFLSWSPNVCRNLEGTLNNAKIDSPKQRLPEKLSVNEISPPLRDKHNSSDRNAKSKKSIDTSDEDELAANQTATDQSEVNQTATNQSVLNQTATAQSALLQTATNPSAVNQTATAQSALLQTATNPSAVNQTATAQSALLQTATNPSAVNQTAANLPAMDLPNPTAKQSSAPSFSIGKWVTNVLKKSKPSTATPSSSSRPNRRISKTKQIPKSATHKVTFADFSLRVSAADGGSHSKSPSLKKPDNHREGVTRNRNVTEAVVQNEAPNFSLGIQLDAGTSASASVIHHATQGESGIATIHQPTWICQSCTAQNSGEAAKCESCSWYPSKAPSSTGSSIILVDHSQRLISQCPEIDRSATTDDEAEGNCIAHRRECSVDRDATTDDEGDEDTTTTKNGKFVVQPYGGTSRSSTLSKRQAAVVAEEPEAPSPSRNTDPRTLISMNFSSGTWECGNCTQDNELGNLRCTYCNELCPSDSTNGTIEQVKRGANSATALSGQVAHLSQRQAFVAENPVPIREACRINEKKTSGQAQQVLKEEQSLESSSNIRAISTTTPAPTRCSQEKSCIDSSVKKLDNTISNLVTGVDKPKVNPLSSFVPASRYNASELSPPPHNNSLSRPSFSLGFLSSSTSNNATQINEATENPNFSVSISGEPRRNLSNTSDSEAWVCQRCTTSNTVRSYKCERCSWSKSQAASSHVQAAMSIAEHPTSEGARSGSGLAMHGSDDDDVALNVNRTVRPKQVVHSSDDDNMSLEANRIARPKQGVHSSDDEAPIMKRSSRIRRIIQSDDEEDDTPIQLLDGRTSIASSKEWHCQACGAPNEIANQHCTTCYETKTSQTPHDQATEVVSRVIPETPPPESDTEDVINLINSQNNLAQVSRGRRFVESDDDDDVPPSYITCFQGQAAESRNTSSRSCNNNQPQHSSSVSKSPNTRNAVELFGSSEEDNDGQCNGDDSSGSDDEIDFVDDDIEEVDEGGQESHRQDSMMQGNVPRASGNNTGTLYCAICGNSITRHPRLCFGVSSAAARTTFRCCSCEAVLHASCSHEPQARWRVAGDESDLGKWKCRDCSQNISATLGGSRQLNRLTGTFVVNRNLIASIPLLSNFTSISQLRSSNAPVGIDYLSQFDSSRGSGVSAAKVELRMKKLLKESTPKKAVRRGKGKRRKKSTTSSSRTRKTTTTRKQTTTARASQSTSRRTSNVATITSLSSIAASSLPAPSRQSRSSRTAATR